MSLLRSELFSVILLVPPWRPKDVRLGQRKGTRLRSLNFKLVASHQVVERFSKASEPNQGNGQEQELRAVCPNRTATHTKRIGDRTSQVRGSTDRKELVPRASRSRTTRQRVPAASE